MPLNVGGGALEWEAILEDSQFNKKINNINNQINDVSKNMQKQGDAASSFFDKAAKSALAFFSVSAASNFLKEMVNVRGEFQQLEIAFTTMLKSKSAADQLLKESVELAASTPFGLMEVANASKQLLAYGVAAKDVTKTIEMLGNVSSGVGSSIGDIAYLYGTLKTQGRAFQQDINQFTNRGIPIIKELASQFNVTESEVRKLVETGKVGFPQIEKAFKNMTSESGMFFDLMKAQSKSLTGQLANLGDAWDSMMNDLGKSQEGLFSGGIEAATELIENYKKVIEIIEIAILSFGAYKAASIVTSIITQTQALGSLSAALKTATGMQGAFNLVAKANPVGLVVAALTAAIGVYAAYKEGVFGAKDALTDMQTEMNKAVVSSNSLFAQLKNTKKGTTEFADAIKLVNDRYGSYLDKLLTNKSTLNDIEAAQKRVTSALLADIAARSTSAKIEDAYGKYAEKNEEALNKYADAFAKAYGSDRLPEFFTAMQKAVDATSTSTQNFGKVAQEVYAQYIKPLGGIKYDYFNFKDDIQEVGILKRETDGLVNKLQAFAKGFGSPILQIDQPDAITPNTTDPKKPKAKKDDTELRALESRLDRQAAVYERYQAFITDVNKKAAKERFAAEIGEFETYSDYLQAEMNTLLGAVGDKPMSKWTESQIKQYDAILLASVNNYDKSRQAADESYKSAYQSALNSEDQILKIKEEYAQKAIDLGDAITNSQKQQLKTQEEAAIRSARDEAFRKTEIYKKVAEEAIVITRAQLKEQIKAIEELLSDGSITGAIKDRLEKELSSLKFNLNLGTKSFNLKNLEAELDTVQKAIDKYLEINKLDAFDSLTQSAIDAHPELKELIKRLQEVAGIIVKVKKTADDGGNGLKGFLAKLEGNEELKKFAEWGGMASGAFNDMSSALGGVDTQAGYALDTVSQLVGSAAEIGGAIATGNPVQMVGAIAKGIASVFSIGKKVKEMNAAARQSIADFYAQTIQGEKEYQDLLNQRAIDSVRDNKTRLQGIRDEIALRKKQADADAKEFEEKLRQVQGQSYVKDKEYTHGTWFRKAKITNVMGSLQGTKFEDLKELLLDGKLEGETKALVERLVELEQKGYDGAKAMAELAKETAEIFTGTTSDNLTNSLANMFREGKTGVQDLANFFESTMQDAALSVFKNKVLAEMMSDFYEKFSEAAQSGDELTEGEISSLQELFQTNMESAKKQYEDMMKVTGMPDNSNQNQSGMAGRIASSCTEESMNKMESRTIKINITCQH